MEVYIEYVIIDNLIINYILLTATTNILKLNAKKFTCFFSALLGSGFVVAMPYLNGLNVFALFVLKVIIGLFMVLIVVKQKNIKSYLLSFFVFISLTFLMGGFCYGIINMLGLTSSASGVILLGFEIPVSIVVALGVVYVKILVSAIKTFKSKKCFEKLNYTVKISLGSKDILLSGFLDTGNKLKVNNTGVVVIGFATLMKLFPKLDYSKVVLGDLVNCGLNNAEFVSMVNSSGKTKMLVFTVSCIQVIDCNNKVTNLFNQKIGLAKTNFNKQFDCLLSPEIFI